MATFNEWYAANKDTFSQLMKEQMPDYSPLAESYSAKLKSEQAAQLETFKNLMAQRGTMLNVTTYSDTVGATNRDMYIDNTGKYGYVSSSLRYKENVLDMEDTDWIYQLRPVNFNYKNDEKKGKQYGLIAEEVEKICPELCSFNDNGEVETVEYKKLIPVLLKVIHDLKKEIVQIKEML